MQFSYLMSPQDLPRFLGIQLMMATRPSLDTWCNIEINCLISTRMSLYLVQQPQPPSQVSVNKVHTVDFGPCNRAIKARYNANNGRQISN